MKIGFIEKDGKIFKRVASENYNYVFDTVTGNFMRWGKTKEDNPKYSPYGPEILDIEISTICSKGCSWCYKSNTDKGTNMKLMTFIELFNKFPKNLTQIAFGIGDIDSNKNLWLIMRYCRLNGVIPNITINGEKLQDEHIQQLITYCGAVAVSMYDEDKCFGAIDKLTKAGLKQANIHMLLCEENYDKCIKLIDSSKTDKRLKKLNAIVFLWLKPKGKRNNLHPVSKEKYKTLVKYAFKKKARIGFDSCSAPYFLEAVKDEPNYKELEMYAESCESTLFSYYINAEGIGYPCSFCEGEKQYKGIDIKKVKNFMDEVWNVDETVKFRENYTKSDCGDCRKCQAFKLVREE